MAMHPARQAYVEEAQEDNDMGISLADLPIDRDHFVGGAGGLAPEKASAILDQMKRRRDAANIAVPTNDAQVRTKLRSMGEPITLFGEDAADRRARLRELLLGKTDEDAEAMEIEQTPEEEDAEEEFFTEGGPGLLEARKHIAQFSIPRSKARLELQKLEASIPLPTHRKHRKAIKERLQGFDLMGSQIAGDRPVAITRFAPNGEMLAAGSFNGGIKLMDVPNLDEKKTLKASNERVSGVAWLPGATMPESGVSPDTLNLASGDSKGDLHLWSLNSDTPIGQLGGHSGRVCRIEFHPSGQYLASASEDTTWRLWDIQTSQELLIQEGHSRGVFAVSFNGDGSLVASAGFDSIGRVWDLRTGRTVMILDSDKGHAQPIHALDWGVDGYRLLSGGADGWVKCWDLRKVDRTGSIGAHRSVVSDLRWFKGTDNAHTGTGSQRDEKGDVRPKKAGTFVVTSGYDKTVNIFSADDWALVKSLTGHSGNVMSVDVSQDGRYIASSGMDRTVKLWGHDDGAAL